MEVVFNPLNAELNPICHLLALLGAHHILHVSRKKTKTNGTVFSKDMIPRQWVSVPDVPKRSSAFIFKGLEIREENPFFSDLCSVMYYLLSYSMVQSPS